ncbi:single-stranded DNA-binding protein [Thioalkalivibrio sulfidiphilus]|uniref:single-stranded DNA-binding protein n=1 Tax=Thioalkalivibrio sulfidiphilus TaxID=1033854 RepID=UPI003B389567
MANDLNLCQFIGRLGADPEQRHTPSGDSVVNIRIAVGWKGKNSGPAQHRRAPGGRRRHPLLR